MVLLKEEIYLILILFWAQELQSNVLKVDEIEKDYNCSFAFVFDSFSSFFCWGGFQQLIVCPLSLQQPVLRLKWLQADIQAAKKIVGEQVDLSVKPLDAFESWLREGKSIESIRIRFETWVSQVKLDRNALGEKWNFISAKKIWIIYPLPFPTSMPSFLLLYAEEKAFAKREKAVLELEKMREDTKMRAIEYEVQF